jgi:hypothetical protein
MPRFRMITVALAAAALTLLMSQSAGAGHWRHRDSGISFGFSFGSPYYYDYPYPIYRPYRHVYPYAVPPRRIYRSGQSAHVNWCYHRYRSYRAWDNTFQPYYGPRRLCRSPYWG